MYTHFGDYMNKVKIYFCLFLFIISFLYVGELFNKVNIFDYLMGNNKTILSNSINNNFNDSKQVFEENNESSINDTSPIVYFYNTHDTEEYKSNVYNITPNVKTVSQMLREELEEDNIYSVVEEQSIKKGLDKLGYDYSGTYEISLNYLKEKKEKYDTLKYYFDIHRDSVKGENSRTTIDGKSYAKIMFLIGKNHDNYKKNVSNVKIMEEYLNKHYKGILRSTYYQPLYAYNQDYAETMFLVEFGGVDNTLEELYNSAVALADAINYYIGGDYEE